MGLVLSSAGENPPPPADLHQLYSMPLDVVVLAQLAERGLDSGGRFLLVEARQPIGRNGTGAREERGLKQLGQPCPHSFPCSHKHLPPYPPPPPPPPSPPPPRP